MEDAINEALDAIFSRRNDICKCERCRLHVRSGTLNSLSTKYKSIQEDKTLRVQGKDNQVKIDATLKITEILEKIKAQPLH